MATTKSTRRKKTAAEPFSEEQLRAHVLQVLSEGGAVTSTQLVKALPKAERPRAVDKARELAQHGRIVRLAKGRTERFFAEDPLARLDRLVPEVLAEGALEEAKLKREVERRAPGHGALLKEWLKGALARAAIHPHAPKSGSRTKRYGREPDLRLLLKKTLQELRKALPLLARQGVDHRRVAGLFREELGLGADEHCSDEEAHESQTLQQSAREHAAKGGVERSKAVQGDGSDEERRARFLSALRKMASRNPAGALLSVRELREQAGLAKPDFDAAALDLSSEGLLVLHHHDHPGSLSDAERQALVRDGRGTHYVGVALREAL